MPIKSHPSRVRELKPYGIENFAGVVAVAPLAGA